MTTSVDVRGGALTGTGSLARLVLRRDRFIVVVWIAVMVLLAVALAAGAQIAYPTEADRIAAMGAVAANPALLALRGPVFAPTTGGLAAQGFVSSGVLLSGLVNLLLVVRNTRVDEQLGRRELLGSTVVGRQAPLAAALVVVGAGNLGVAVLVGLGLVAVGLPVTGSLALGLVLALGGIVFAAVGAIAAQVTERAGGARALGIIALAALLVVAGAGELTGSGLVWWSPFGWARHVRSFADEQWWVFLLFVALVGLLGSAAFALSARRDIGAGLVPARSGPAVAGPALRSPVALAWRLHRGPVLGWTAGAALLGALLGAALASIGGLFDTPAYREVAASLGGGDPAELFLHLVLYVLAQIVAASAVAAVLQVRAQETGGTVDLLLSGPVDRVRWALGHLAVAAAATACVLLGLGLGVGAGEGRLLAVLGETTAYLPACLLFAGLAAALTGCAARLAGPVTWTALGLTIAVDFLGEFGLVDAATLRWFSPFMATSVALAGGADLPTSLTVLVLLAAGLAALGLLGLRRRDLDSTR